MQYLSATYSTVKPLIPFIPCAMPAFSCYRGLTKSQLIAVQGSNNKNAEAKVNQEWIKRQGTANIACPIRLLTNIHTIMWSSQFAQGTAIRKNGLIYASMQLSLVDPEAFFFCAKHERSHIAHNDLIKYPAFRLVTAVALPILFKNLPPLVNFGIAIGADRLLSYYLEGKSEISADAEAIKTSTNEELLGGIRFWVADRVRDKLTSLIKTFSLSWPHSHPSLEKRIDAIIAECAIREIAVPERIEINQLARLITCLCEENTMALYDDSQDGVVYDLDEYILGIIKNVLTQFPELCAVHSIPWKGEIDVTDVSIQRLPVIAESVTSFDTERLGIEVLQAYRNKLENAGLSEKKKCIEEAENILFDLSTGAASFVDSKGECLFVAVISKEDLKALSGAGKEAVIEKMITEWSQLPVTMNMHITTDKIASAVVQYQDTGFVQALLQKHNLKYVINVTNEPANAFIKFLPGVPTQDLEKHASECFSAFARYILKVGELNDQLEQQIPHSKYTMVRWKNDIEQDPLWILCANAFFPTAGQLFQELLNAQIIYTDEKAVIESNTELLAS